MYRTEPPQQRQWTVLVYFCADNNLAPDAVRNLNEMLQVGSSPEVQLLALCDLPDVGAKTYVFRPLDSNGEPRTPLIRKVSDSLDTGDPRRLQDVLRWAVTEFEAEHYCVVIWGHSSGWDEFDECRITERRDAAGRRLVAAAEILGRGDNSTLFAGTSITVEDLEEAGLLRQRDLLNNHEIKHAFDTTVRELQGTGSIPRGTDWRFDVVGFDSCLMGMGEVAGQLKDSVRYLVASEAEVPNRSWPYRAIFEDLLQNPWSSPEEFASVVVNSYVDACASEEELKDFPATLSVLDLGQYKCFAAAMETLRANLQKYLKDEFADYAIHKCLRVTQSYFANSYVDIYDFCRRLVGMKLRWQAKLLELKARGSDRAVEELFPKLNDDLPDIVRACKGVMAAIDGDAGTDRRGTGGERGGRGFVFYERHAEAAGNSHGVSIFFPSISRCYPGLVFSRDTEWAGFLREYIGRSLGLIHCPCRSQPGDAPSDARQRQEAGAAPRHRSRR